MVQVLRLPVYSAGGAKRYTSLSSSLEAVVYDAAGVAHAVESTPEGVVVYDYLGVPHVVEFESVPWSMNLTTLARVKAHLGGITSTQYDAVLTGIIDDVSARFEKYMRRTVAKQAYTEVYELSRGNKLVSLRAAPVESVDAVAYSSHPSLLDDAGDLDSILYTSDDEAGFVRLMMETGNRPGFVRVEYTGGMATDVVDFVARYPDIARQADVQCAYEWGRRNTPGGNVTMGAGGTSFDSAMDLLPGVTRALDLHRRLN